jgi:mono/diheme cytochrome c family protein
MRTRLRTYLVVGFAAMSLISEAYAAGDVARGQALANVWCTSCHIVDRKGTGTNVAPPFPKIAERGAPEQRGPRAFLFAPHPPMPDFNLARDQIEDIVAYLNSLAPK